MQNLIFEFILLSFAVWRVSSLITSEDGPWDIFAKLRNISGVRYDESSQEYGTTSLSRGILCLWCVSLWVGLPIAFIFPIPITGSLFDVFVTWLAFGTSVILVDTILKKNT